MKTIKDWLEELPEGIKEKALLNYKASPQNKEKEVVGSLSAAISGAFVWIDTPEGHEFWENLYLYGS